MGYRPITDVMILARSKTPYYGAFPAGFLHRARALMGVGPADPVLHICGGRVKDYPYSGFGVNDKTLDLDPACHPDFLQDARDPLPFYHCNDAACLACLDDKWGGGHLWNGILIDRPYTEADAAKYAPGEEALPPINDLLKRALERVPLGHRVGVLDYMWPHPGKFGKEVAVTAVGTGRNNRARWFTVFERLA